MLLAASSSSRALVMGSSRRCRWPPPRLGRDGSKPDRGRDDSRCGNSPDLRRFALSTISFDVGAAESLAAPSSPLSDSAGSQSPSAAQSAALGRPISRGLSRDTLPPDPFQRKVRKWMSVNPRIAPYKSEEALARLWEEQKELSRGRDPSTTADCQAVPLTTESVNAVLRAWCDSDNGETAAERAERLLRWMEGLHSSESEALEFHGSSHLPKPDYQSYATAIDAWSRAAEHESALPVPAANGHAVSQATKAGFECARRAEDLLMHMQKMHERELQNTQNGGASKEYNSEIQPDTQTFNLVLRAWSRIRGGTRASAVRATRILDLMQEIYHAQSMHVPEWQGVSLSRVQPSLETYRLVVEAWARAAHAPEGPDRAEEILRHLLSLSKAGNAGREIVPDAEFFHIVMRAHAGAIRRRRGGSVDGSNITSGDRARRATALLDWMELLGARGATARIRPTSESYRIALSAWAWSHCAEAPAEAEGVLRSMMRARDAEGRGVKGVDIDSQAVRPETRDFNTVINCCSFARKVGLDRSEEDDESLLERQITHREIFDIAERTLEALLSSSYAQPDSATFAGIIRACINLLPNTNDRDAKVIDLFRLAYRTAPAEAPSDRIISTSSKRMRAPPGAGCVDANVLRQLRHALPSAEDYIRVREGFEQYRSRHAHP